MLGKAMMQAIDMLGAVLLVSDAVLRDVVLVALLVSVVDVLLVMLVPVVLRNVVVLVSIVLPIPNGCFMPIFVIGAIAGRLYGEIVHALFHTDLENLPTAYFSVVGAAALTAGSSRPKPASRSPRLSAPISSGGS